jgi:ferric-dicitrate binding protein FerR (iron transport regulator)
VEYVPEHIDELIAKVLTDEASLQERAELQEWLSESSENKEYFEQMEGLMARAARIHDVEQFDTDAADIKNTPCVDAHSGCVGSWSWCRSLYLE